MKQAQKNPTSVPTCRLSLYLNLFLIGLFLPSFSLFAQYENIVINEISGDGGNIEAGNDGIVELAGPVGADIGCMVITNTEWAVVLPAGTTIPADGIFLIGCESRNNASSGFYTGLNTGLSCSVCDFPGLVVDFDVCNDANAAYVSASLYNTYGFTLDNPTCKENKDGDQLILFRPDGTPHDAVYWGAPESTYSNGGATTMGGSAGSCGASADHVSVQIGVPYTLGDNDNNGIINDYTGTHIGFKSSGGNATAVNLMPNGNDDLSNPEIGGIILTTPPGDCEADAKKYTVPSLSDPIWVNLGLSLGSCNSTHIRINDTSPMGNSIQEANSATTSSHKDDPDLNADWMVYETNTLTPSSTDPTIAAMQWQITNHPNPSERNDTDSWDFFYDVGAGNVEITEQENLDISICNPQTVTFSLQVFNYQHVEPSIRTTNKVGSFINDETGTDVAWTISSVGSNITDGSATSNEDGITTFTFTSNTLVAGSTNSFTLVWDDYTDCCGSSKNSTVVNQTDAHECYEKISINVTVGEAITLSGNAVSCPGDYIKNVGQIDFSSLVTSTHSYIQYHLRSGVTAGMEANTGTLIASNTKGIFDLSNTLIPPLAVILEDLSNCSEPLVITIEDDCLAPPACPKPVGATIDKTGNICPNESFTLALDGTNIPDLPNGGTIDWYVGPIGFDPFANEGTLLGQSLITINEITVGPVINEILVRPSANNGFGGEYFELAGPPGLDLSCFIMTDGDFDLIFPLGTTIPADGFLVVGSKTKAQINNPEIIDIDIDNCGCFNHVNMVFTDGGEFLSLYSPTGTFLDGVIWGNPIESNDPNLHGVEILNVIPSPIGCSPPTSVTTSGHAYINSGIASFPMVGISMERDIDATGTWQMSDVSVLSTPGASNDQTVRTPVVADFTTTLGEINCNQTVEIKGIVNPATIIAGSCEQADLTTTTFTLTVTCPEADLQKEDINRCLPVADTEVLSTINLSNGSGNYDVVVALDHNGTTTILNKNNVTHPLEITYADLKTALGTTSFSEVELSIQSITDAAGEMCTGTKDVDLILITVQSSPIGNITASLDLTNCAIPNSGSITFEFSPVNSGPWEFEYSINGGEPIAIATNITPFVLPVSAAGIYELKSVNNVAACTGTIGTLVTQTVNPPEPLSLTTISTVAVCNDGLETVNLDTDITLTINEDGNIRTGNAATIGNITWYKSDPSLLPNSLRPLVAITPTIFAPTSTQDYFFIYKNPSNECELIGNTSVGVNAAACCTADAGDIIPPADLTTCKGEIKGAFTANYTALDETEPNRANFQYTFLLINENQQIIAESTTGAFNFSALRSGKYNVFGLSYANDNFPNNLTDYLASIRADLTNNDISQIETDENSAVFCLNLDGLTDSGSDWITIEDCAVPIPTFSQWGTLIFGLLLLNLGCFLIIRLPVYEKT